MADIGATSPGLTDGGQISPPDNKIVGSAYLTAPQLATVIGTTFRESSIIGGGDLVRTKPLLIRSKP